MSVYSGRFAGRTAVITGGGSGVGREAAARITAEGGQVILWDRDAAALEPAQRQTGAVGVAALDVADYAAVEHAAGEAFERLGRIDILIASAGITGPTATLWDYPVEDWRRVFDVNVNGIFNACKALVPFMLKNDYGRIVNVSSVAGKEGNPNASAYSASKAAVLGLTKSLGKELAKTGVRVNAITPATFQSPILKQLTQAQVDYMLSKIPMGRIGEIEEVAAMICWMASDECTFTTGAAFDISGGRTTY